MDQYSRNCLKCNKLIIYKNKCSFRTVQSNRPNGSNCRSCGSTGVKKQYTEETKKAMIERVRKQMTGKNNPMFGKSWVDAIKAKYSPEEAERRLEKHRTECVRKGKLNGMFGRSVLDVWIEKYGKEEADKRWRIKNAKSGRRGKDNHQFGKPSPRGSGNGWSGTLDKIHFRSLLELSYLYTLIQKNINYESGELKKHKIQLENGKNYFPDFYLIDQNLFIEVKPSALVRTKENIIKFSSAKEKHGDNFQILTEHDIHILPVEIIDKLILEGRLVFKPSILEKYERFKLKKSSKTCW